MKILVTGGAGFIGHHVVARLASRKVDVRILDDFSTGSLARLDGLPASIEVVTGSVLDDTALDRAVAGCDSVVHLAAIASVAQSFERPREVDEVNAGGTIEVVLAAARHHLRRVVLASSSAVYGASSRLPCREDLPAMPMSPYATSKLAAEHYLHMLGREQGVDTVALRYFNVFGPGQDPTSEYSAVVPRFVAAVLGGSRPVINGDPGITRDYLYVDDVVDATLAACLPSVPSGLTVNVGSGIRQSLRDVLEATCVAAGRNAEPLIGPARPGDIQASQADIGLARRALGFRVAVPFREGVARTVAWYRAHAVVPA